MFYTPIYLSIMSQGHLTIQPPLTSLPKIDYRGSPR